MYTLYTRLLPTPVPTSVSSPNHPSSTPATSCPMCSMVNRPMDATESKISRGIHGLVELVPTAETAITRRSGAASQTTLLPSRKQCAPAQ